ncbi:alpha/beta hydrolase fold protein [Haloterrigena turkmenica DSM 5511]|uniref:Alpha/beta hydrolase fold protein n=1 Tax=Haloterrigena turkmenica (strain ATCC 51198 / DSM 5511 / JCM 9101 / NCIMB 13204 / VKM B-1734 / 4k) TaxID=543526 RepID=D2RY22_HALTV|nr:alpha/beta fold hydrolase [Haloterrigena turkmenica]ADB61768.1 alpha/beta hydrolase fold protein [Haloterrigena turkmenica DSM 5511]
MVDHETWGDEQATTTVTVDGHDLEVAYHEDGPSAGGAGDEPPVVFLHGIPTWSFLWRDIVPAVAKERRTIAPDLVGYGNSAMQDGFDRSIRAQEVMLEGLLEDLDIDRVVLVAHDIGGGVALRFAAHNPDAVEQLVLSNAVCYDSWPVEFVSELGLPSTADREREELEARLESAFVDGAYGEADPEFVEGMKTPWLTDEGHLSLVRDAVATNTNHTTEIDYGAIEAETLLLWGEDDVMQPYDYAERLAEDIDDAALAPVSDAYHWVPEDRSDAYGDRLLDFLK